VISVEVKFYIEFDENNMPSSYSDSEYLKEVIHESIEDAMYDVGASMCSSVKIEVDKP
jgi:hypothetical protein